MHHSIRQAYIVKFGIIVTAYALFFYFLKAQQAVIARGLAGISRKAVRRFPQVDSNNRKTLVLCHLIDQFGDIFSRRVFIQQIERLVLCLKIFDDRILTVEQRTMI